MAQFTRSESLSCTMHDERGSHDAVPQMVTPLRAPILAITDCPQCMPFLHHVQILGPFIFAGCMFAFVTQIGMLVLEKEMRLRQVCLWEALGSCTDTGLSRIRKALCATNWAGERKTLSPILTSITWASHGRTIISSQVIPIVSMGHSFMHHAGAAPIQPIRFPHLYPSFP